MCRWVDKWFQFHLYAAARQNDHLISHSYIFHSAAMLSIYDINAFKSQITIEFNFRILHGMPLAGELNQTAPKNQNDAGPFMGMWFMQKFTLTIYSSNILVNVFIFPFCFVQKKEE